MIKFGHNGEYTNGLTFNLVKNTPENWGFKDSYNLKYSVKLVAKDLENVEIVKNFSNGGYFFRDKLDK